MAAGGLRVALPDLRAAVPAGKKHGDLRHGKALGGRFVAQVLGKNQNTDASARHSRLDRESRHATPPSSCPA